MVMEYGRKDLIFRINMKEILLKIWNVDLENFSDLVKICTKEILRMIKKMDMVKCIGLMVPIIKEFGKMAYSMV